MRAELDAVGGDLADFGQAENLEAAAVSQERAGPVHELMQTAGGAKDIQAGADGEMVGVAQENLGAHLAQLARVQRLHAGLRANRHEDGGLDCPTGGREPAQARPGQGIGGEQFKHRDH